MNKCERAYLPGWMLVSGIVAGAALLTLCLGLMLWAVVDATERANEPAVDWQAGKPLPRQSAQELEELNRKLQAERELQALQERLEEERQWLDVHRETLRQNLRRRLW